MTERWVSSFSFQLCYCGLVQVGVALVCNAFVEQSSKIYCCWKLEYQLLSCGQKVWGSTSAADRDCGCHPQLMSGKGVLPSAAVRDCGYHPQLLSWNGLSPSAAVREGGIILSCCQGLWVSPSAAFMEWGITLSSCQGLWVSPSAAVRDCGYHPQLLTGIVGITLSCMLT
jgi:hypothetical protein